MPVLGHGLERTKALRAAGLIGEGTSGYPIRDNLFWFGDGIINPGDLVILYTGAGTATINQQPNNTGKLISLFWGRPETVLHDPNVTPILFRVDAVVLGEWPEVAPVNRQKPVLPNKTSAT